MTKKRQQFTAHFKAKVAMEAIKNDSTTHELAVRYGVHPSQVQSWKSELLKRSEELFTRGNRKAEVDHDRHRAILERKVGQLTIENDFLKKNLTGYLPKSD